MQSAVVRAWIETRTESMGQTNDHRWPDGGQPIVHPERRRWVSECNVGYRMRRGSGAVNYVNPFALLGHESKAFSINNPSQMARSLSVVLAAKL